MNHSHSKQIQRQELERQQAALEEDVKNLTNDINSAPTVLARGRLERQQQDLFNKSDEVANQIDQLYQEQWQEQSSSWHQELFAILSLVDRGLVNKAYRSSLPELPSQKIPNTLEGLILRIIDLPDQFDEIQPLQQFINILMGSQSLDSGHREKLRSWVQEQGISLEESPVPTTETKEICLMIKVVKLPPDKYMVSAAIAGNVDPWMQNETLFTTTTIDVPSVFRTGCTKEELPEILPELIASCVERCEIDLSDLTVQWFLPIELMGLDLEHWPISIGRQQYRNGEQCRSVIVRCADRHFSQDYRLVSGRWRENWKRISPSHQALEPIDLIDLIKRKTKWQQKNFAGCHFVEHPNAEQQEVAWDSLMEQGLPIAIWVRRSTAPEPEIQKVVESVTTCQVFDLAKFLTEYRGTVLPQMSTSQAPMVHLSLLWDNPFFPFPTLEYEST